MQDKQEAVTIFVNASAAVPENGLTEPGRAGKDAGQNTDQGRPGRAGQWQVPGSGTVHGQMQGGARVTTGRSRNQTLGAARTIQIWALKGQHQRTTRPV